MLPYWGRYIPITSAALKAAFSMDMEGTRKGFVLHTVKSELIRFTLIPLYEVHKTKTKLKYPKLNCPDLLQVHFKINLINVNSTII